MEKLKIKPAAIGAAGVYPYSESLYEMGARVSRYGDPFNLFKVVGLGEHKRIWVPRGMAPLSGEDVRREGLDVQFYSKFKPRNEEQARVIKESVELLKLRQSFIVEAPTAMGKTACTMDIIAKVGKKTLVVVHKEDLRDQWLEAIEKFLGLTGKDVGLIQGDTFQVAGRKIVIALIQSLAKEDRYPASALAEFGLMVMDETHHVGADFFSQACYRVPAMLRLGLSATPKRSDGKFEVIHAHIGEVRVRTELVPMTAQVIARRSPWKLPMVRNPAGGVMPLPHTAGKCGHVISMVCNNHARNRMMAEFIFAAYKKDRCIAFLSDRLDHLDTLQMMLTNLGISASSIGYYVGGMTEAQREDTKTKDIMLGTYQAMGEGTNIPHLDTLVMGSPKADVRQIVGRILRAHEGKKQPVVFDLVDDTSSVFAGYWRSRQKWYKTVGAAVLSK